MTMDYGFENFWLYSNAEGSAAHKAAPLFEEIRERAMRKIAEAARQGSPLQAPSPPKAVESRHVDAVSVL